MSIGQGQKNLIPKVWDYIATNANGMYWFLFVAPHSGAAIQNALSDIFGSRCLRRDSRNGLVGTSADH